MEQQATETEGLRIDKWLWCARFYKSRSQATAAVAGGLVHVNGERVKASRAMPAPLMPPPTMRRSTQSLPATPTP